MNNLGGSDANKPLVGEIKRSLWGRLKVIDRKKLLYVVIGLVFLIIAIFAAIYFSTSDSRLPPEEVIGKSKVYINQTEYERAYRLLSINKDREIFNGNVEFYVLISRAAVLTDRPEEANEYATIGADYYSANPSPNASDGYILQSILSGTYVDEQILKEMNTQPRQPIQPEQLDDPEFQG